MFENQSVLIRQFFLTEFLFAKLRLIMQRTNDTLGNIRTRRHFHHADIMHIAPLGVLASEIEIPAIEEFVAPYLAGYHLTEMVHRLFLVIRVEVAFPFFRHQTFVRKEMSIELVDISFADDIAHHIASGSLDGLFHHFSRKVGFCHAFTHTPHHDDVIDKHDEKSGRNQHKQHRGDELERPSS